MASVIETLDSKLAGDAGGGRKSTGGAVAGGELIMLAGSVLLAATRGVRAR